MKINRAINNKRGSGIVFMTMLFTALAAMILASIGISRALVLKSECKTFGRVWARAVLSEYDVFLLKDYNIMGYHGSDKEVEKRLDRYMEYSMKGKLDASISNAGAELGGYELRDPANFREAIKNSFLSNSADTILKGGRIKRSELVEETGRFIRNEAVIETLPSGGIPNSIGIGPIIETLKKEKINEILSSGRDAAIDMTFIKKYLCSHTCRADDKKTYFTNEWEYVVCGELDDDKNYKSCCRRIFLIRNALNMAYLYKDEGKSGAAMVAAEIITPGPAAPATQVLILELWAAAESREDIKTLTEGGRIPVMKTPETWKVDLGYILNGGELKGKLDDDSRINLDREEGKLGEITGNMSEKASVVDGNSYEDYLLLLMSMVNSNVRLLRAMDIVQINMKYRYYSDFNLDEYYCGVNFNLKAGGRKYETEDKYK